MANPRVASTVDIDGVWLLAHSGSYLQSGKEAWIGAPSPSLEAEVSESVITVDDREDEIIQSGKLHLDQGEVDGVLMTRHGLTANQWLNRLTYIVKHQRLYVVRLVSSRYDFPVRLGGLTKTPVQVGGPGWRVTFPFRELPEPSLLGHS